MDIGMNQRETKLCATFSFAKIVCEQLRAFHNVVVYPHELMKRFLWDVWRARHQMPPLDETVDDSKHILYYGQFSLSKLLNIVDNLSSQALEVEVAIVVLDGVVPITSCH